MINAFYERGLRRLSGVITSLFAHFSERRIAAMKKCMSIGQKLLFGGIAVAIVASPNFAVSAVAAQGMSYSEAWRICKAQLDKERSPGTTTSNERFLRGGACMAKYGHRF
jgi:hypothetical protein